MFNLFRRNSDIFKINKIRYKQEFAITHEGKLYGYLVNVKDDGDIKIINIKMDNKFDVIDDENIINIVKEKIKNYL